MSVGNAIALSADISSEGTNSSSRSCGSTAADSFRGESDSCCADSVPIGAANKTHNISKIMQWLKGISSRILLSEFAHLRKQFWGRHLWARGYLAISSGNVTDEMIQQYIEEQEGEPIVDDSRFQIDSPRTPRLTDEGRSVVKSKH